MNKRIKKKYIKNILDKNLNIKYYSESFYTDPCEDCKYKSCDESYICMEESIPIGKLMFKFKCMDLVKVIDDLTGYNLNKYQFKLDKYDEFEEAERKCFKYIRYMLQDCYNINNYTICFDEEISNGEIREFIQVKKIQN